MPKLLKYRPLLIILCLVPLILGLVTSLFTLFSSIDYETLFLWVYPNYFHHRTLDIVSAINVTYEVNIFRPLHYLSFTMDFILFGTNSLGYRLENLLWFLLTVVCLMLLMRRLKQPPVTIFSAGIFLALHPSHAFMLYQIHSRTDVLTGLFIILIVYFFTPKEPPLMFKSMSYWLSLVIFLIGIFWKENLFIIPLLLLFGDLCFGWTKGIIWRRALLYLPFVAVAVLSLLLRVWFLSGFGYRGWDMWKLFSMADQLPVVIVNYLNTVWGITFWQWPFLGLILTLIFLIFSDKRARLALLLAFLLLFTYLPSKVNYMHVFVCALGLSIWMGMLWRITIEENAKLWCKAIPWVTSAALLVLWVPTYTSTLPQFVRQKEQPAQIVKYLVKRYPDPQPNTSFALEGITVRSADMDEYRFILLDYGLKLALQREDVGILLTEEVPAVEEAHIRPVQHVTVPSYLK